MLANYQVEKLTVNGKDAQITGLEIIEGEEGRQKRSERKIEIEIDRRKRG